MKRTTLLRIVAALALACAASASARADVSSCTNFGGIAMERVTYLGPFNTNAEDPRAEPDDPEHKIRLRGWLYYDATGFVQDAPVIIYNHGHDEVRNEPCGIAKYFVRKGFVVFAPLRRGHRGFPGSQIKSTGVHTDVYVNKCMRSQETAESQGDGFQHLYCGSIWCRQEVSCSHPQRDNAIELYYMRRQRDDVEAQINYIKAHPAISRANGKLADPQRIAILGHSYGGSLMILANEIDYGQNVAIDISGAELSWGDDNPFWELDLKDSMLRQQRPMYFLQPKNGRTLKPTRILFGVAVNREYRSQAAIFPPAPWDSECIPRETTCWDEETGEVKPEWSQAHGNFLATDQVKIWGPSVIEFMNRYPRTLPQ